MSRSRKEKVRISAPLLRRSPAGPGSIGSRRPARAGCLRRGAPAPAPVVPLIAPPGVAYVEHTSTGPTIRRTRVGAVPAGTDTQPVSRVCEKCSTTPVVAEAGRADGALPPRLSLRATLRANDTCEPLLRRRERGVRRRADTLIGAQRTLGDGHDPSRRGCRQ